MTPLTPQQQEMAAKALGGIPYTFHRESVFYCLSLGSDFEARANAECNPGTLRVVNELSGETVFEE